MLSRQGSSEKGRMWHCRSQRLLGLRVELLLCYVRWIASFQVDSEWRNVTVKERIVLLRSYLCCPGSVNLGLNEAWVISGSVGQAPAFVPLSKRADPCRVLGGVPDALGGRMHKAHPKTSRAATLKYLAPGQIFVAPKGSGCGLPRTVSVDFSAPLESVNLYTCSSYFKDFLILKCNVKYKPGSL